MNATGGYPRWPNRLFTYDHKVFEGEDWGEGKAQADRVVEALGGHGELVGSAAGIRPALERAFRSGLPACLNVICDPTAEYPRSSVLM